MSNRLSRTCLPIVFFAAFSWSTQSSAGTIEIVEFYNTELKHYFITNPDEAAMIDAGAAGPGWIRTGKSFVGSDTLSGDLKPVCRFYTTGANSHFYTAEPSECDYLRKLNPNNILGDSYWTYEGVAFYANTPSDFVCPAGTKNIVRFYNNRADQNDSNHRYVADRVTYDETRNKGWVPEGTAMCSVREDAGYDPNSPCGKTEMLVGAWRITFSIVSGKPRTTFYNFSASDMYDIFSKDSECAIKGFDEYGKKDVTGSYRLSHNEWTISDPGLSLTQRFNMKFTSPDTMEGQLFLGGTGYPATATRIE